MAVGNRQPSAISKRVSGC